MNFIPVVIILFVLALDVFRRIINIGNGSLKGSGISKGLFWGEFFLTGILINFISMAILLIIVLFLVIIWPFVANTIVYNIYRKQGYDTYETKKKSDSIDIDKLTKNFKQELRKNDNISIKKLLNVFLNKFENINSVKNMFSYLPKSKFEDISETDEIKMLNKMSNKSFEKTYDNFSNKYYKFKEMKSQNGELDIDFVDFSLANVRIQLFNNDYTMEKIKQYIDKLVIVNWDNNKNLIQSNRYNYLGETENGLVVGIRKTKNSISIAITDKRYN